MEVNTKRENKVKETLNVSDRVADLCYCLYPLL